MINKIDINIGDQAPRNNRPEYIRLPKARERCIYTGLSRSTLNELILPSVDNNYSPPVKSVPLKKRDAIRGIRLIHYGSLMSYFDVLIENEQEELFKLKSNEGREGLYAA